MADERSATSSPRLPSHVTTPEIGSENKQLQSNGSQGPSSANMANGSNGTSTPKNKLLDTVRSSLSRTASDQSGHLSVSGLLGQHRTLHETGSGYVAPVFEGKDAQMDKGQ